MTSLDSLELVSFFVVPAPLLDRLPDVVGGTLPSFKIGILTWKTVKHGFFFLFKLGKVRMRNNFFEEYIPLLLGSGCFLRSTP